MGAPFFLFFFQLEESSKDKRFTCYLLADEF